MEFFFIKKIAFSLNYKDVVLQVSIIFKLFSNSQNYVSISKFISVESKS